MGLGWGGAVQSTTIAFFSTHRRRLSRLKSLKDFLIQRMLI